MERHGLSQRHACRLVGMDRSTVRYQSKRPDDAGLRLRLRELAAERRRFGYRRLGWMLAREGHVMNHKRLYRLYREEKLMVRRRGRRKRALGTHAEEPRRNRAKNDRRRGELSMRCHVRHAIDAKSKRAWCLSIRPREPRLVSIRRTLEDRAMALNSRSLREQEANQDALTLRSARIANWIICKGEIQ
jgi:hypothetical protein